MKIVMFALAAAAFTTSAASGSDRTTDVQYLKAARCKGLAASLTGLVDSAALDTFVKQAGRHRTSDVMQRADDEYDRARREARRGGRKETLTAELTGPCQAFLGGASDVAKQ